MSNDAAGIAQHLRRSDPLLGAVIDRIGTRTPPSAAPGFRALARAIIYQQISGAAGDAILNRVRAASGARVFPPPRWFRDTPEATLRSAGLSPQKVRYLQALSRDILEGSLRLNELPSRSDEEVLAELTRLHGVGRWTAQMYLLFNLGRPDVLPTGDLGLRKAVQRLLGMKRLPAERTVERWGRRWAPYRSHATFYLWRSLARPAPPVPRKARHRRPTSASRRSATPRKRSRRSR
jgi:DNA-3-methyladenine glycosylase II